MILTPHELEIVKWHNKGYWFDVYGALRGPNAIWAGIPENNTQPAIVPRMAILHSNAAPAATWWEKLIAYWRRADIHEEAHFQVSMSGLIAQAMSVHRRADCNYKANRFLLNGIYYGAISFETEDNGAATLDQTGWTLPQLDVIISALTALVIQFDIHCTAPAYWDSSGIGHHILHPEWSLYKGKTCPGAARIAQMDFIRRDVQERSARIIYNELGRECTPQ